MSISAAHADAFSVEAIERQAVWAIRDKDGFPSSTNASGDTAMPFWSTESRAKRVVENVAAYRGFQPVQLELPVFLDRWLPGLEKDGLLVGVNWSGERATGYDMKPAELLARIEAARR